MQHSATQTVDNAPLIAHAPSLLLEWQRRHGDEVVACVDASLLLLDISGFTGLSERLAETGKAGVEEVSALLNSSFGDFLTIGHEDGGVLIKFGGDALLLYFDGAAHELRACRAAARMAALMRAGSRPNTSVGPVNMRVTISVSSGRMVLMLAGRSHRELVVGGAEAGLVVALERAGRPGEVVVSPATARLLEPHSIGERRGRGHVLIGEPAAPSRRRSGRVVTGLDPVPFIPGELRLPLSAGPVEGEHRQAAIGFLRFGPINARIEDRGAHEVAREVDLLVANVQAVADDHGVCFRQCDLAADGGTVFLVAGAPRTTGHDEESMLCALRRIADMPHPMPVRIGVSRGRVFTGEIGTSLRRTYAVIGDAVNVAARLCERAVPGQILASPSVVERSKTAFDVSRVAPLRLRGRSESVDAVVVGRAEPMRRRTEPEQRRLVGRDMELGVLHAALDAACAGQGGLVQLISDPGMGKSRLLEELRTAADDRVATLTVSCTPYDAATPYYAARTLLGLLLPVLPAADPLVTSDRLRRAVAAVDPELTPWVPLIASCLDVDVPSTPEVDRLDPTYRRAKLHATVSRLLNGLLPRPALLCLEDAHWMDEASAALLQHLCRAMLRGPWLLCVTRRPGQDGLSVDSDRRIDLHLNGLDDAAAVELVRSLSAEWALSPDEMRRIGARAGGNPLFLRELVHETLDAGGPDRLPDSVEAALTARLDRLGERDRRLLRYAAVLGPQCSAASVSLIVPDDPHAADPKAWERLDEFLTGDAKGGYVFRHELIREVAYEGLSYARRRELHARAGAMHEGAGKGHTNEIAELLSLHYSRGHVSAKTWEYSQIAAERARAKGANVDAAEFFRRALAVANDLPTLDRAQLARSWEALGDVAELAGRYSEAADAYARARRIPGDREGRARLLLKEGTVCERIGSYGEALRHFDRGLLAADRLPAGDERLRQRMELRLAIAGVHHRRGRQVACVSWARLAEQDAVQCRDRPGRAHAYSLLHVAFTTLGHPHRARYRDLALPIFEELGDQVRLANTLNNLGIEAYYRGDWETAVGYYDRATEARDRAGDVAGRALELNNVAEVRADQGHLDEARRMFERSHAVSASIGYAILEGVSAANLGRTAARQGRFAEATTLLDAAAEALHRLDARSFVLETRARQAELAAFANDPRTALRIAIATLADAAPDGGGVLAALLHRVRGWALAQSGDLAGAADALSVSADAARSAEARYELALSLVSAASVAEARGDRATAQRLGTEARQSLADLGVVSVPSVPGVQQRLSLGPAQRSA